jgi:hypothetical protein
MLTEKIYKVHHITLPSKKQSILRSLSENAL